MRRIGERSCSIIALLSICLLLACGTAACSDDSGKSAPDMLADQDEDLSEDLTDTSDVDDTSDGSDFDVSDLPDEDMVSQDGDTTDQDAVDATDADGDQPDGDQADMEPQCSDTERLCLGMCAQCPSADGVDTFVCNGLLCEVERCEVGYESCATGCCLAGSAIIASDGDEIDHHSLALTSAGVPHVAYRVVTNSDPSALGYVQWDGEGWQSEILEGGAGMSASGVDPELAFDSSDTPHIAYLGQLVNVTFAPMYAVKGGASWDFELVRSTSAGDFVSLALDSAGLPHIAYHSNNDDQLIVGSRAANGTWSHDDIVVSPNTNQFGRYVSLAIDSGDTPHLVAASLSFGNLHYYTTTTTSWREEQLFAAGERSDLAVDGSDFIHIVFHDDDAGVPRYARPIGASTWSVEQLGTCSDCGRHIAIALDSQDRPHVLYSQAQSSELVYEHWDGQEWQRQSISSTGPIGPECDIALDAQDRAHLTFRNFNDGTLEYLLVP